MSEFLIYEQDTCIGSVEADNEEAAWEKAKRQYGLNEMSPIHLEEIRNNVGDDPEDPA